MSLALLILLAAAPAESAQVPPRVTDYPAKDVYRGAPAAPVLSSARAMEFRTMLRNGAKKGPNFAGHYTVVTWGCGSGCLSLAIVDAKTGRVHFDKSVEWVGSVSFQGEVPFEHSAASRLLVVRGCLNDKKNGVHYYEWKGGRLAPLYAGSREGTCLE